MRPSRTKLASLSQKKKTTKKQKKKKKKKKQQLKTTNKHSFMSVFIAVKDHSC